MANRQLGLIHCKLGNAFPRVCNAIFRSTILPRLDYCKDIEELNKTRTFAARIITHHWHDNLPKFYKSLNCIHLQTRRRIIKLKVCFNIVSGFSCIPLTIFTQHPYPPCIILTINVFLNLLLNYCLINILYLSVLFLIGIHCPSLSLIVLHLPLLKFM